MNYTISQVAERVGLSSYTLRYYEKEGLLPHVQRNKQGIRAYTEGDLFWIELIKCLKDTGMGINQIRYIVELSLQGDGTLEQRKMIFNEHKEKLREQMEELKQAMQKIDKKIAWYEGKSLEC